MALDSDLIFLAAEAAERLEQLGPLQSFLASGLVYPSRYLAVFWAAGTDSSVPGFSDAHAKLQLMAADRNETPDDPPPFLGSWRRVYTAILLYLALLIGSFYVFTRAFS